METTTMVEDFMFWNEADDDSTYCDPKNVPESLDEMKKATKKTVENYVPNNEHNLLITKLLAKCSFTQTFGAEAKSISSTEKRQNHDKKYKKLLVKLLILSIIILPNQPPTQLRPSLRLLSTKYLFLLSDATNTLLHGGK